ncbi:MAG TPA: PKD domain-containing protein [Myxococcales bacterium]|nr:PKD domain-containing protein [Myxococcales bacterium]
MRTYPLRFRHWFAAAVAVGLLSRAAPAKPLPFTDGFEPPSGFPAWTATRINGANSLVQSANQAWGSTQSLRFTYAGSAASAQAAAVVDFDAAVSTVFVRFWLYVPAGTSTNMAPNSSMRIVKLGDQATGAAGTGGNAKVNLLVTTDLSAKMYLSLQYEDTVATMRPLGSNLSTVLTEATWHYVEIGYQPGVNRARIFIDDPVQPKVDANPPVFALGTHNLLTCWVGLADMADAQVSPLSLAIDDVRISTTQSGTAGPAPQHFNEIESGQLTIFDSPPGKAGGTFPGPPPTGLSILPSSQASDLHRGLFGFRVTDTDGSAGAGAGVSQFVNISGAGSGLIYHRLWWKPSPSAAVGSRNVAALTATGLACPTSNSVADLIVAGDGTLSVGGCTGSAYTQASSAVQAAPNVWHLLELQATGLGTPSGTRSVYLDGALAVIQSGLNFSGFTLNQVSDGQTWSTTRTYQGTDYFDDLRISTAVMPSRLVLTVPALTDRACSAAITVQARDSDGTAQPVPEPTTVSLTASGITGTFYGDPSCAGTITNVQIPVGTSTATVYFKPGTAGPGNLTASNVDLLPTPAAVTVASIATKLAFVTAPQTLAAGTCATATVQSQEPGSTAATVASAKVVTFTSPSTTMGFFSDATCLTPQGSATIAAGQSTATFFFRDTTAGTPRIDAAAPGLTGASQTETINPGTASRLAFITPQRTVVAGACSGASLVVTVQSQDTFGNASNVASATTVSLSSNPSGAAFFSDSACSSSASSVTIAAGTNSANLFFRDTRAGTLTLTGSASGFVNASQAETVSPGPPSKLAFITLAQSVVAGACSATVTVQVQDSFSNPSPLGAASTLNLSSAPANVSFFDVPTCGTAVTSLPMAAGTSSRSFLFQSTVAGTPTLTATSGSLANATQMETIAAGPPSVLVFTSTPKNQVAGTCSSNVVVQTRDSFGNDAYVAADTTVNLTSSSGTLTFHSSSLCGASITSVVIPSGNYLAGFNFKDTTAGTPTITARSGSLTNGVQTHTIRAGPPSQLAFATPPRSVTAGACSAQLQVESRDSFGNATNVTLSTQVSLSTTATATGTFYPDSSCSLAPVSQVTIPGGGSSATFYYKDTRSGSPTVTASNLGLTSPTQGVTVTPGSPNKLVFTSSAQSLVVGACSAVTNIQVQDALSNASPLAAGATVALSSTSGTTEFHSNSTCTSAITSVAVPASSAQASFYFRDPTAGTPALTVQSSGLVDGTQQATFNNAAPARLAFATPPRTVTAGGCSPVVTVQSQDTFGNAAPLSSAKTVTLSIGSATGQLYSDSGCTTLLGGQVTIGAGTSSADFYFRDTAAGTPAINATAPALSAASQTETVAAAQPVSLAFVTGPQTLVAGACSAVTTVEAQDLLGNAAPPAGTTSVNLSSTSPGASFYLSSDTTCAGPAVTSVSMGSGSARASFRFRDTRAGTPTVRASAAGISGDGTQGQTINPGPPAVLAFLTLQQSVTTGTCSDVATVESRDALGNASPVAGDHPVALSSTLPGLRFFSDDCVTAATGALLSGGSTTASFYFANAGTGTATLTAAASGLANAMQQATFVASPAAAALQFTTPSQTVEAGVCSPPIKVRAAGASGGNAVVSQATPVALSSSSPTVTFHQTAACGPQVTGVTIPAGDYRATFYFRDTAVEAPAVSASSPGLTGATQGHTIVCPALVDGARCDDADLCNGRETCQAGVCRAGAPLSCDDGDPCTVNGCDAAMGCQYTVIAGCCRTPKIAAASTSGVVGVPYRISSTGRATLDKGTGPITWTACDAPPAGLQVDSVTGLLTWTPPAPGSYPFCLKAVGACGEDTARWTVQVVASQPAPVVAMTLSPRRLSVGEELTADGAASQGVAPLTDEWIWGDGTVDGYGVTAKHAYARAGTYPVTLRLYDSAGQVAEASGAVEVVDAACTAPKAVRITGGPVTGDGSVSAALACEGDVGDPAAVYDWDFADGATGLGQAVTHSFSPGAYLVRVRVTTSDGCRTSAETWVKVTSSGRQPPTCDVFATPSAGPAPLNVSWEAVYGDPSGALASAMWRFSDGITADAQRYDALSTRTLEAPGTLRGTLEVTNATGLVCRASRTVEASLGPVFPPSIATVPAPRAVCGTAYVYGEDGRARAEGTPPFTWSLGRGTAETGAPKGMTIDPSTGQITWTPEKPGPAGPVRVALVVENPAGTAVQDFLVQVECSDHPCGCSSGGAGLFTVLMLLGAGLRWRRRAKP